MFGHAEYFFILWCLDVLFSSPPVLGVDKHVGATMIAAALFRFLQHKFKSCTHTSMAPADWGNCLIATFFSTQSPHCQSHVRLQSSWTSSTFARDMAFDNVPLGTRRGINMKSNIRGVHSEPNVEPSGSWDFWGLIQADSEF